jgi:hypothetical protein
MMTMGQAWVSRERNNSGASGPRTFSPPVPSTGTGGGTVSVAMPFPTRGGGSRGAAVACGRRATARRPACNGRDAARVVGRLAGRACHSRGGKPWRDRCQRRTAASTAVRACNGRDTARAGGWLSRRTCHSRGREPRRDRCQRCTAASSRCKRARGVTRRGWAGSVGRVREQRVQRNGARRSERAVA